MARKLKTTAGHRRHVIKTVAKKKAPKKFKYDESKYLAAIATIAEQIVAMAQEDVESNGYVTVNDLLDDYANAAMYDVLQAAKLLTS